MERPEGTEEQGSRTEDPTNKIEKICTRRVDKVSNGYQVGDKVKEREQRVRVRVRARARDRERKRRVRRKLKSQGDEGKQPGDAVQQETQQPDIGNESMVFCEMRWESIRRATVEKERRREGMG